MTEQHYEFRRRLGQVHEPGLRSDAEPGRGETLVGAGWRIVVARSSPLVRVAFDLADYFRISMGEQVPVEVVSDVAATARDHQHVVVVGTEADFGNETGGGSELAYTISVSDDQVVLRGADHVAAAQASYHVEDVMSLRGLPALPRGTSRRTSAHAPRLTHSGWALDEYPDAYLSRLAHAGMTGILLYATGVDEVPGGRMSHAKSTDRGRRYDVNDLIARAHDHGLDVYLYSLMKNLKHPDDPGAEEFYESTLGALFRAHPRARGLVLVGESCEIPSRDPRTTQQLFEPQSPEEDGLLPNVKPYPGWWPCTDYPRWLELVSRVVRRHSPAADIVFWSYNWGWAPEEDRVALVERVPTDITLLTTFEMWESRAHDGITTACTDYTISFAGPGAYFRSEAAAAHGRGLTLYTMANTGGLTWDVGVVPFLPVPFQWSRRHEAINDARQAWGLSGIMDSHHYGFWPSFVSELATWAYWEPSPPPDEILAAIAARDYGGGAHLALEAWQLWSEAIRHYCPTREDQYGPFRIGPTYPLVFRRPAVPPFDPHAMWGATIVDCDYQPQEGFRQAPDRGCYRQTPGGGLRYPAEIESLTRLADLWTEGLQAMTKAVAASPSRRRHRAQECHRVAEFVLRCVVTTIHVKQWWLLKSRILLSSDRTDASGMIDQLLDIAQRDADNVRSTVPLVEADSRLGWEPSMGYVTDAKHLAWKLEQLRRVTQIELPAYRHLLGTT